MRSIKLPSWTERLLGLTPVPVPPHVFALEAGALRYGSFHPSSQGGLVFDTYREVELPADTFAPGPLGGPLGDAEAFGASLRQLVAGLPAAFREATLVFPDAWLRLSFTELSELPRQGQARLDVLRWKLKRLVPFRVEDLRISAVEVEPLAGQQEPHRLLLGFANEVLVAQVEAAFAGAGIRLGTLTNTTLAVLASLERNLADGELGGLVLARDDAYTVSFFSSREPVLYRYKAFTDEMPGPVRASSVHRDLRMTTSYVREHFAATPVARIFLISPPEDEETWLTWLREELELPPEPLAFEHFPLARAQVGPTWLEAAPLVGAACLEVA